jgi:hypothetical protein
VTGAGKHPSTLLLIENADVREIRHRDPVDVGGSANQQTRQLSCRFAGQFDGIRFRKAEADVIVGNLVDNPNLIQIQYPDVLRGRGAVENDKPVAACSGVHSKIIEPLQGTCE